MYLYTFIATLQIQKYPQHFFLLFFYRRISKERGEKLITSSKISLNNYSNPRVEQFETTRSSNNFREFSLLYNPLCSRGRGRGHWEHGAERSLFSYPLRLKKKKAGRDVRAFKILSTLKSSKTWEMHRAFRTTVTSFSRASSLKSDCQSRIRFIFLAEISMLPNFFIIYRFSIKKEGRDISISQKRGHDKLSILLRKEEKCFFHPLYIGGNDEKIIGNPWKIVGKILWFF